MLLTKLVPGVVGKEKVQLCKSGDRVALVNIFKLIAVDFVFVVR